MSRRCLRIASLSCVLLLVALLPALAEGTIRGHVTDTGGNPIAGVEVICYQARPPEGYVRVGATSSDADGSFELALEGDEPVGNATAWFVCALAEGWTAQCAATARPDRAVELRMVPSAAYAGRVLDDRGQPVAGAKVAPSVIRLPSLGDSPGGYTLLPDPVEDTLATTTDGDGRFSLSHMPEGAQVDLEIAAAGFGERTLRAQAAPAEIRLTPAGSLSGRLTGPGDLSAFEGVVLEFYLNAHDEWGWARANTVIAEGGAFSIPELPPGTYSFHATTQPRDDLHILGFSGVSVSPREETPLEVTPLPTAPITGRAVAEDTGEPIEGFALGIQKWDGYTVYSNGAETDADGRFTVYSVAGEMGFSGFAERSDPERTFLSYDHEGQLEVGDQPIDLGEIRVSRSYTVTLQVVDTDGNPVEGARVRWVGPSRDPSYETLTSDDTGTVWMPWASKGIWRFEASTDELATDGPVPIVVPRERTATLVLKPGTLSGLQATLLYDDGSPARDAEVWYTWWTGDTGSGKHGPAVGEDGVFLLKGLSVDGQYHLDIRSPNAPSVQTDMVTLKAGEITDLGTFTLQRGTGALAGTVLDPDGQPLGGVTVYGVSGTQPAARAVSDDAGHFRLEGLQNAAVCLVAEHADFGVAASPAHAGDEAATLRFGPADPGGVAAALPPDEAWALVKPLLMECLRTSRAAGKDSSARFHRERLLERLVVVDPEAAFAEAQAGGDAPAELQVALGAAHLEDEFDAALELIGQGEDPMHKTWVLIEAARKALPQDPDLAGRCARAALDLAKGITDAPLRVCYSALSGDLLREAGDPAGAEAVRAAAEESKGISAAGWAGFARGSVAVCLAEVDLDQALELLATIDDESEAARHMGNIARRLAAHDPDRAVELLRGLKSSDRGEQATAAAVAWFPTDRFDDAVALARSIEEPYSRGVAYARLATVAPAARVSEMLGAAIDATTGSDDLRWAPSSAGAKLAALACLAKRLGDPRAHDLALQAVLRPARAVDADTERYLDADFRLVRGLAPVRPDLARALAEGLVTELLSAERPESHYLPAAARGLAALDFARAVEVIASALEDDAKEDSSGKARALLELLEAIDQTPEERETACLRDAGFLPPTEDD